ncbi:hypothetical protein ETB97_002993 [Aspergillus alliaceus]|uniref:Uncharacterized protein n=1 Tax=Petromyces alliaceus TaxID=209559 RepID=A0A8H5ZZX5_PETAA|nr:hypothetical protein ETB97_002993 [Aspergillus burnettii]
MDIHVANPRLHEVVDDNGAYLPPSPPEKQNFWRRYPGSNRSSNNHRDLVDENEPFSISRESFDSYRRSFDISARSPVSYSDVLPSRTSLDSRFSRLPSPYERSPRKQPTSMEEEHFEEVGLDDDNEAKPKKKGIFSRFGDFTTNDSHISTNSKLGFHLPGRKRGQSNVGSEMGCIKTPPAVETEVRDA